MKFIDITKLNAYANALGWEAIRNAHLASMGPMSPKERKAYIKANPRWNQLQKGLMEISNNKCWYTEAPGGNNDLSVEHFRPKNRAVFVKDFGDPLSKVIVSKKHGYWWKAYCLDNLRLAGTYANLRRSDRLNPKGVKGKGNYFPLDISDVGRIAKDEENLACEIPILLDPTVEEDVALLTFDANGEAISAAESNYENNRVLQSIFYYHLDLEQLVKERVLVWKDCEREINEIKDAIDNAPDERARRIVVSGSFKRIRDYVKNNDRPYSAVVKACIMLYSELDGYKPWLKRYVRNILL